MSKVYLTNAFALNMLSHVPAQISVDRISAEEFCNGVRTNNMVNAIGHEGTAQLVNQLCQANIKANRIQVKVDSGDELLVISLNFRLEEGKVYSAQELEKFYNEGKIVFYRVQIIQ